VDQGGSGRRLVGRLALPWDIDMTVFAFGQIYVIHRHDCVSCLLSERRMCIITIT